MEGTKVTRYNIAEVSFFENQVTHRRTIHLWPDRAFMDCQKAWADFFKDRGYEPELMLLGIETWWNLCFDITRRTIHGVDPPPFLDYGDARMIRPTEFRKAPILVDDSIAWSIRCIPKITQVWPQYSEDNARDFLDSTTPN